MGNTNSVKKGVGFGLTSGVITTIGLIVGLGVTHVSKATLIGGIITIALADSLSDALGMHISEESDSSTSHSKVWITTIATLLTKIFFTSTFIVPIMYLPISWAIVFSVLWGLSLLMLFSYFLATEHNENPISVMSEHFFVASLVITLTYLVGNFVASL